MLQIFLEGNKRKHKYNIKKTNESRLRNVIFKFADY